MYVCILPEGLVEQKAAEGKAPANEGRKGVFCGYAGSVDVGAAGVR